MIASASACQQTATELQPQEEMLLSSDWNWGPNKENEEEHNVLMLDNYEFSEYEKALWHFEWLVSENPRLHPKVYDTGLAIYDKLISETEDEVEKAFLISEKDKIAKLKIKYFPESQDYGS